MTGLAPERDREHSIGDQLRALNVGFMERLHLIGESLKFEAVAQMDEDERRSILALLDAMILKHQTKRFFVPQAENSKTAGH